MKRAKTSKIQKVTRGNVTVKIYRRVRPYYDGKRILWQVKPSNILVTLHDGVPVTKVIDFGIAYKLDSEVVSDCGNSIRVLLELGDGGNRTLKWNHKA